MVPVAGWPGGVGVIQMRVDQEGHAAVGIADDRDAAVGVVVAFDQFRLEGDFVEERREARRQVLHVDDDGVHQRRGALRRVVGLQAEQVVVGAREFVHRDVGDLRAVGVDFDLERTR